MIRTFIIKDEMYNFFFFFLFTRKEIQPVFHQTVYRGVFTVLRTVLSSLIVLFIAILCW
jgi:hypothetical protein